MQTHDTHPDRRPRREILDALENLWAAAAPFARQAAGGAGAPEKDLQRLAAAWRGAFDGWTCPACQRDQGKTPNRGICDPCAGAQTAQGGETQLESAQ